jgi:hypothetical protein
MRRRILKRYRRDSADELVIDISASKVSDLYDDFDKYAPFVKKELDYDLVEYLIDSVRELGPEPFSVQFTFSSEITSMLEERVRKSMHSYFKYLLETNWRELMRMFLTSGVLLGLGMVMLGVSIYLNLHFELEEAIVEGALVEGLVIAAWVSVWEGLSTLLLNWPSLVRTRHIYGRLSCAQYLFKSRHELEPFI